MGVNAYNGFQIRTLLMGVEIDTAKFAKEQQKNPLSLLLKGIFNIINNLNSWHEKFPPALPPTKRSAPEHLPSHRGFL